MKEQTKLRIYYIAKGLLSILMTASGVMYFLNYEGVKTAFINLGYPTYLIYPLAIAKILGVIAIWANKSDRLKEWAYAGFFFDLILAFTAHLYVQDGEFIMALLGLLFLATLLFFEKK